MQNKITQAVILSAGLGTRLREITGDNLPKVMVPLLGKPLLLWHIEELKKHGITEFFINLFYLPEEIRGYFEDGSRWGVKITYAVEEPEIRGTAGGMKNFDGMLRDSFLLLYGDTFYEINYPRLMEFYFSLRDVVAMGAARRTDHPWDSDLAIIGEEGKIRSFLKRPHKELPEDYWGMGGPYIFSNRVLAYIPEKTYYEIDHQLVPDLLRRGYNYYAYKLGEREFRKDIGTPERYRQVEEYLKTNPSIDSGLFSARHFF